MTQNNNDGLESVLKTLNDNVARLALAQIAIADELHMIRRVMEGEPCSYDDPYTNAIENAELLHADRDPVMYGEQ